VAPDALTNWAGNVTFDPARFHRPASVDEVRALVAGSERLRVLGTGHSFSRIAETDGDLLSLERLNDFELDAEARTVTVRGRLRYGDFAQALDAAGLALPNLGSLPHISVAGACATGTHGSGDGNTILAGAVSAIELVTATGDLVTVRRDDDDFPALVVGLGASGVVTALTLDLRPAFELRQHVYDRLPAAGLAAGFEEIFATGYSVSGFTRWSGPDAAQVPDLDLLWVKHRSTDGWVPPQQWHGATPADGPRHPVPGMPTENATEQLGVPGRWYDRLPHFRLEFTPSAGEELQTEYLLPRRYAVPALAALGAVRETFAPLLMVGEIRTVAADGSWLSAASGRDSVALHFTWHPDQPAVEAVLPVLEAALAPFEARPHWGKLFATAPETVAGLYPRHSDALAVIARYDPAGKFRNPLLDRYLPRA
jgi:xylitol oxidase